MLGDPEDTAKLQQQAAEHGMQTIDQQRLAKQQQGTKPEVYHHVGYVMKQGVPLIKSKQLSSTESKLIPLRRAIFFEGKKDSPKYNPEKMAKDKAEYTKLQKIAAKLQDEIAKDKKKWQRKMADKKMTDQGLPPITGRWRREDHANNQQALKKEYEYILKQISPQPQEFPKEWTDVQDFEAEAEREEKNAAIAQARKAVYDEATSEVSGDGTEYFTFGDLIAMDSPQGGRWAPMHVPPVYGSPAWVYNVNGGQRARTPRGPPPLGMKKFGPSHQMGPPGLRL